VNLKYLLDFKSSINNDDFKQIRRFYQPIIGCEATVLWSTLVDNANSISFTSDYQTISSLLKQTYLNIKNFTEARKKLEAVGLLKTFEKLDYDILLFSILKPLNSEQFISNNLLLPELKKQIGVLQLEKIVFENKTKTLNKSEFLDITTKYFDVFNAETAANNVVDNTRDIQLPVFNNSKEAQKALSFEQFIKYLTNTYPSPSQILALANFRNIGFSDYSLNLIINYSFEINGKVVIKYVTKIAQDFLAKGFISTEQIDFELTKAINAKKGKVIESFETKKTNESESSSNPKGDKASIDKIFNDLFLI
jgi:replication initiation and membrane attachment protein